MTCFQKDVFSYSCVTLLAGALLCWIIPAWSPEYPGYGVPATVMPNIAAGFMLLLAVLGLIRCVLLKRKQDACNRDGSEQQSLKIDWRGLLAIFLPCFLLMPAMSLIGFIGAGIFFLLYIQLYLGQRRVIPLIMTAAIPVLTMYVIMRYGLGVPMP